MPQIAPLLALALFAALLASARAQTPLFPFVLPWDDATAGTATDVSFLNTKPAGQNGPIIAKNGHFVETATGQRLRFLGVNFAAGAAFPTHADAAKVAARLAKLGINIVRMHHMDNITWGPGQNIWDPAFKDHQHLDPAQLDKLDYLIYQLKQNGIYTNINLHVSRQFTPDDGFPATVNDIKTSFDKRVDEYDRRMIQLQKNYARDLLTHVNPYTKLSYTNDPAIAVVEINNENSLVGDPWTTLGAGLSDLPDPFRAELVGFWNDWLQKKYKTDAALQAAWLKGVTPPGPSLLSWNSPWSLEHQGTSMATLATPPPTSPQRNDAAPMTVIAVTQTDGTDWHVQSHITGLDLKNDATYTVSFRAWADTPRPMPVAASLDQSDWHNIGLAATAQLTTAPKDFHYTFDAHDTVPHHGRIAFTLGGQTGTVSISDLTVKPGAEGAGLQPGESLAAKTVPIPETATKTQRADWISFLADTERAYADEMRAYLKNDLHVRANIICSQMGYGGLTSVAREAASDFADNHAYWQHPSFPHKAWDANDWTIPNTSMVADLANGGRGTLESLAEYRFAGKPYTVSEYNHPAPNDYQSETVPILATFAAFQDWDMVYLFDYGGYGVTAQNDKIQGYFAVGSNPAKMAFLPAAAMIFRGDDFPVAPRDPRAKQLSETVPMSSTVTTADAAWHAAWGKEPPPIFRSQISLGMTPSDEVIRVYRLELPGSEIHVTKGVGGAQYEAVSDNALALVGYLGGRTITPQTMMQSLVAGISKTSGPVAFTFPAFGNNFAAVTLTAMDKKSLTQSKRMLLTLVGKVENQGMTWNAARTSVGAHWGHGPTMAEGIPATVTFTAPVYQVYALDGAGHPTSKLPLVNPVGRNGEVGSQFTVGPQYKTLWYEITR